MMRKIKFWLAAFILLGLGLYGQPAAADETSVRFSPGSPAQIRAVSAALNLVGTPYRFGGEAGDGVDCSGLIRLVFRDIFPSSLPRTSQELFAHGRPVNAALGPGDLVFFDTAGEGPSHVGMYTGDGYFVHSASEGPATGVILSAMTEEYYRTRYLGARRLLEKQLPLFEIILASSRKELHRHERPLSSQPLGFVVLDGQGRPRSLQLSLEKDGSVWISRRLTLPAGGPASFRFWPPAGRYSLRIAEEPVMAFDVE